MRPIIRRTQFFLASVCLTASMAPVVGGLCDLDPTVAVPQFGVHAGSIAGPISRPELCTSLPPVTTAYQQSLIANYVSGRVYSSHRLIHYRNVWLWGGGNIPALSVMGQFQYPNVVFSGPGPTVDVQMFLSHGSTAVSGEVEDVQQHYRVEFFDPVSGSIVASAAGNLTASSQLPETLVLTDPIIGLPVNTPLVMRVAWQWALISGGSNSTEIRGWAGLTGSSSFVLPPGYAVDSPDLDLDGDFSPLAGSSSELRVDRRLNGMLDLSWQPSCSADDNDYAIYEGQLGNFASHQRVQCSTSGLTSASITSAAGSRYFLVVPQDGTSEGSYGSASSGVSRSPAVDACGDASVEFCPIW